MARIQPLVQEFLGVAGAAIKKKKKKKLNCVQALGLIGGLLIILQRPR